MAVSPLGGKQCGRGRAHSVWFGDGVWEEVVEEWWVDGGACVRACVRPGSDERTAKE